MNNQVGMSTNEIINSLKNISSFIGCFACNDIPPIKHYPSSFIVNTDRNNQPGTHWVAIYMTKKSCLYFDSFGEEVQENDIMFFLRKYYEKVTYSMVQLQDYNSVTCGQFCISFIRFVKDKKSYAMFIDKFVRNNLSLNDNILYSL